MRNYSLAILVLACFAFISFNFPVRVRYFYVGYAGEHGEVGGVWAYTNDGTFISSSAMKHDIKEKYNIKSDIWITSFYEFKNKKENDESMR